MWGGGGGGGRERGGGGGGRRGSLPHDSGTEAANVYFAVTYKCSSNSSLVARLGRPVTWTRQLFTQSVS